MSSAVHVGRNDPCPCGSGRKFKACCEGRAQSAPEVRRSRSLSITLAAAGLVVAGAVVAALLPKAEDGASPATAIPLSPGSPPAGPVSASTPGAPQPPGPAPAGKVWSVEHGHWHDVAAAGAPGATPIGSPVGATPGSALDLPLQPATPPAPQPQPPGPAPAGKVWSPEHGHWHDTPAPAPAGSPAPK